MYSKMFQLQKSISLAELRCKKALTPAENAIANEAWQEAMGEYHDHMHEMEIAFTPPAPCGITDQPRIKQAQTWDAESLWEAALTESLSSYDNADEIDTYDLMVGEVLVS